jgi:hypothetical protein
MKWRSGEWIGVKSWILTIQANRYRARRLEGCGKFKTRIRLGDRHTKVKVKDAIPTTPDDCALDRDNDILPAGCDGFEECLR